MNIYTRTGDDGETGLLGGHRVSKTHLAIDVCGTLDETNGWLGLIRSGSSSTRGGQVSADVDQVLHELQADLFELGAQVAACLSPASDNDRVKPFPADRATQLETIIDRFDSPLPPLQTFILPSGGQAGCQLHLARAVSRRAERQWVALVESGVERDLRSGAVYLNRLADLLFVLARSVNHTAGQTETPWLPK